MSAVGAKEESNLSADRFPVLKKVFIWEGKGATTAGLLNPSLDPQTPFFAYRQMARGCLESTSGLDRFCLPVLPYYRLNDIIYTIDTLHTGRQDVSAYGIREDTIAEYYTGSAWRYNTNNIYRCSFGSPDTVMHVEIADDDHYTCADSIVGGYQGFIASMWGWHGMLNRVGRPGMARLYRLKNPNATDFISTIDTGVARGTIRNGGGLWTYYDTTKFVWPSPGRVGRYVPFPRPSWW